MGTAATTADCVGKWLGRAWRGLARQEARATHWMMCHGMPQLAAASILWIVKLALLAVLLYAAFWIAVVLGIVLIAATVAQHADQEEQPHWLEKDPDDHREDLFYHPLSYNDDPDPRFHDPRFDEK